MNQNREAYSDKRLIGRIIIFSGKTGRVLRWVETPDKKESYFSPVLYTLKNGSELVIFGTGGETHGGALYIIQLTDLYHGKIDLAVPIYKDEKKGKLKYLHFTLFQLVKLPLTIPLMKILLSEEILTGRRFVRLNNFLELTL